MQVRVTENPEDFGKCGCGRSLTGYCNGWHGLTEDQYQVELELYEANLFDEGTEK
jgi:CDGSH-type Zn-finger protein